MKRAARDGRNKQAKPLRPGLFVWCGCRESNLTSRRGDPVGSPSRGAAADRDGSPAETAQPARTAITAVSTATAGGDSVAVSVHEGGTAISTTPGVRDCGSIATPSARGSLRDGCAGARCLRRTSNAAAPAEVACTAGTAGTSGGVRADTRGCGTTSRSASATGSGCRGAAITACAPECDDADSGHGRVTACTAASAVSHGARIAAPAARTAIAGRIVVAVAAAAAVTARGRGLAARTVAAAAATGALQAAGAHHARITPGTAIAAGTAGTRDAGSAIAPDARGSGVAAVATAAVGAARHRVAAATAATPGAAVGAVATGTSDSGSGGGTSRTRGTGRAAGAALATGTGRAARQCRRAARTPGAAVATGAGVSAGDTDS